MMTHNYSNLMFNEEKIRIILHDILVCSIDDCFCIKCFENRYYSLFNLTMKISNTKRIEYLFSSNIEEKATIL